MRKKKKTWKIVLVTGASDRGRIYMLDVKNSGIHTFPNLFTYLYKYTIPPDDRTTSYEKCIKKI